MGYLVSNFCYSGDTDAASAALAARGVEAMSFWPPDNSVIMWTDVNSVDPLGADLAVFTESGTYSLYAFPCDQQGPWPDAYRLTPTQAAGFAVFTLVLMGAAYAQRAVRRAK